MQYIHILRPFNLSIVALTQWLLWFVMTTVFLPNAALEGILIYLFILDTVLIAASGYVVNDIMDVDADTVNKPKKSIIARGISMEAAWYLYWVLVVIGALIAVFLAQQLGEIPLLWIYPSAVGLLYAYSRWYKRAILLGNIVVSLFCALVPGMILVAERSSITSLLATDERNAFMLLLIGVGYMLFAYLTTMAREIVKDLQDMEGDLAANCRTLPLVAGEVFSRRLATVFLIAVLVLVSATTYLTYILRFVVGLRALSILILPLLLWLAYQLVLARSTSDYARVSRGLKLLMLLGLIMIMYIGFSVGSIR